MLADWNNYITIVGQKLQDVQTALCVGKNAKINFNIAEIA